MKVTLSWLRQFISTQGLSAAEIADRLTMLGLEVDSVAYLGEGLADLVCARVVEMGKHPNADKLSLCQVDDGSGVSAVVCGAPNVRVGMMSAFAPVGSVLPGKLKIKRAKVRGEVSNGMLCSARELGLSEDHTGIMELADDLQPGRPLVEALGLDDYVIEVDLTPNRSDCASVLGIAREIAGFTRQKLGATVDRVTPLTGEGLAYSVQIEDPELCPRYTCRRINGVQIGPSPWWMQRQLIAAGMRPINNIVDITNYVMLELGQPLHAFDYHTLQGGRIVVRRPLTTESHLITLDGTSRGLDPEMLLICDGEGPIAIGGVMGGLATEVTENTTDILLESACFNPVSIRRTSRKLNLPSEASYRFERGVDPGLATTALERAVALMVELAGGSAEATGIDCYPGRQDLASLELRVSKVNRLLGLELSAEAIDELLIAIGFTVDARSDESMRVTVPSFRVDIEREVDLVEEVARLVGYNEIPTTRPSMALGYSTPDPMRSLRSRLANMMTGLGFYEAINYSFISERCFDQLELDENDARRQVVRLLNPLNEEQTVMRSMLLPGLLDNVRRNNSHQMLDLRLFEIGKIFFATAPGELPEEHFRLGGVLCGQRHPGAQPFHFPNLHCDLLDCKGVLEYCLEQLRLAGGTGSLLFRPIDQPDPYLVPGQCLALTDGEATIAVIGSLKPGVLKSFGIKQPVHFFEMDLELVKTLATRPKTFKPLPRFPSVKRDIALIVPAQVAAGDLLRHVQEGPEKLLESAVLFDVYQGKPIAEGMKSVALSVTYRSADRTLDEQTVDKVHQKIVNSLMADFGGSYREGLENE